MQCYGPIGLINDVEYKTLPSDISLFVMLNHVTKDMECSYK